MAEDIARKSALGALGGAAMILANFFSGVIIARILGVEGAGEVAFFVWIVLFVAPFVELGASATVTRYVPELNGRGDKGVSDHLSAVLVRALIASLAIFISCAILVSEMSDSTSSVQVITTSQIGVPLAVGISGYIALQALGNFGNAYLRGMQSFKLMSKIAVASCAIQIAVVTLGALTAGVPGALAGYASGQIMLAVIALMCVRGSTRSAVDRDLSRRVLRYAFYSWVTQIANIILWSRIEVFFLQRSWGSESVGYFTAALALTNLATQGPLMLTAAVLPTMSQELGRSNLRAVQEIYQTATRLLAVLIVPCCLGMAALMPLAFPLIYGESFSPAIPAAIVLSVAAAFTTISIVGSNLVLASERNDFIVLSSSIGALFAVSAGFILIPTYGVLGAAISRALIQIVLVVLGLWFISSRLKCPLPVNALVRIFLAALVSAFSVAGLTQVIGHSASLLPAVIFGAVAYAVVLRLVRAMPREDAVVLKRAAKMLPHPLGPISVRVIRFVIP